MSKGLVAALAFVVALGLPFLTTSTYLHHLMVLWLLYALLALSLNIIIGYLGELSFGHAAFFGVGAYASTLAVMQLGLPGGLGLVVATALAAAIGAAIGFVSLRIVGPQFAILTLGFGSILYTICNYWVDLTRGPMGISSIPPLSIFEGDGLDTARGYYVLILLILAAFAYALVALMRSRLGRAFIATRENAALAASLGMDTFRIKLIGFVVATAVAGLTGGLYAHYVRVITPELLGMQYMTAIVIILMVGGRGTIAGPILGAFIYVGLLELLRPLGPARLMIFAALMIVVVVFLPQGLISLLPASWRKEKIAGGMK